MKNYYEILEVSENASSEIIEKAYKTLAKKYHPDKSSKDKNEKERKMKDINEAYAVLSSEFLREQYDKELNNNYNEDSINHIQNNKKMTEPKEYTEKESFANTTTSENLLKICKSIFSKRPSIKSIKDFIKNDYISLGLTALIMIIILLIMWFIPFTRPFIQSIVNIF